MAHGVMALLEHKICEKRQMIGWKVDARQRVVFQDGVIGGRVQHADDIQRIGIVPDIIETELTAEILTRFVAVRYRRFRELKEKKLYTDCLSRLIERLFGLHCTVLFECLPRLVYLLLIDLYGMIDYWTN